MRKLLQSSPSARRLYYRFKMLRGLGGQSNEARILIELAERALAPKTFVEFGFHPIEFNCAALAQNPSWRGLLIDGSRRQVEDAKAILPNRIDIQQRFLTLDNLDFIKKKFPKIGVLSIDVDGNDYWFLQELICLEPSVVSVEYNSSLGLEPLTVPYDANFDRHEKHASGWYHGASLAALAKLCAQYGYGLAAVADGGANAFFTKFGRLDPSSAWLPNRFREDFSGTKHPDQWQEISHLSYVIV